MTLTKRTITGIIWNLTELFVRRGINIVFTLILAYFLAPEDFGLLAMISIFLVLAMSLMDSGLKEALIRLKEVSQQDLSTVFFSNMVLGLLSYILLFLIAPQVANFYDETRLIDLIRVAGLIIIFNAFYSVQLAILSRELDFKSQLIATLPASFVSGLIAILLGYYEYGVWSLISQMLVSSFLIAVLFWIISPWRPTITFSSDSFRHLFNFGYKLFLSGLLAITAKNMFSVAIAKFYSAASAGLYFLVEKILDITISQLVYTIQNVTYPALSSIQYDNVRLKAAYRKVLIMTTFIIFPALLFMAALADPLFKFIFPEKWWPSIIYFQIICFAFLLYPLHTINLNILKVKGRSDLHLRLEVIKTVITLSILVLLLPYGIEAILAGHVISSIISYFLNSYYSVSLIGYSVREQLTDFLPSLVISFFVGLSIFTIQAWFEWAEVIEIILFGLLALFMYLLMSALFKLTAFEILKSHITEYLRKT